MNWLYTEDQATMDLVQTLDVEKVMSDDTLILDQDAEVLSAGEEPVNTAQDYFAAVRLSRQQARDSALNLLQEAMAYSDETKAAETSATLEQIVEVSLNEAQIESLVIAKGYADCVAYITNEGISVAVAAPEGGLQEQDVAVIADIVISQSDYTYSDIRVVEVK
jgi:stage III sporulation protein AH